MSAYRSKSKVYRKCQQIDPAFDSQGIYQWEFQDPKMEVRWYHNVP